MVVVATWNLENLFRPDSDFGPKTEDVYETKLSGLARVIGAMQPDVLAVEEVGDPDALADLAERLDGDWHIETSTVFEAHHPIRVGFLSRHQMATVEQVSAFPEPIAPVQADDEGTTIDAMPRGALRVSISADGHELDLVACHLKSKLLSFPGGFQPKDEGERARYGDYALARRAAEAVTVRAFADTLLDGHGKERPVVVLGDLTDEPLPATTQILLGPPGPSWRPPASTNRIEATACASGTSPPDWSRTTPTTPSRACSTAAASSSTTSSSATSSPERLSTSTPRT
jgi:endonuclease/exonuclease/phosphatase family protein